MLLNLENLGERTLNKIAEIALSGQIKKYESLTVRVKTDPNLLAKGMLESLTIEGRGLTLNDSCRAREMTIYLESIGVNPLKALAGNIRLTRPARGTMTLVLDGTDLEIAYGRKDIQCRPETGGNIRLERPEGFVVLRPLVNKIGNVTVELVEKSNISSELAGYLSDKTQEIFNLEHFSIDGILLNIESLEISPDKITLRGRAEMSRFPDT